MLKQKKADRKTINKLSFVSFQILFHLIYTWQHVFKIKARIK